MSQTSTLSAPQKLKQMLREEIQHSEELMRWHLKERDNDNVNIVVELIIQVFLLPMILACILVVASLMMRVELIDGFWPLYCAGTVLVMAVVTFFEQFPKTNFTYVVAEKGIAIAKSKATPDWGYPLLRGIAWFAVIVCLIAAMMVGPMAFAGTAGFALLGFKFINAQRPVSTFEYYPEDLKGIIVDRRRNGLLLCLKERSCYIDWEPTYMSKLEPVFAAEHDLDELVDFFQDYAQDDLFIEEGPMYRTLFNKADYTNWRDKLWDEYGEPREFIE